MEATEEIWKYLNSYSERPCPASVQEIMRYLQFNYTEIKATIREICFSKTILLGDSQPVVTPGKIVLSFIASSSNKFSDVVDMQCIDVTKTVKTTTDMSSPWHILVHQQARLNFILIDKQYDQMMLIAEGLRNTIDRQIVENACAMKNQLQSTVTGLGYTTYTTSMGSLIGYQLDSIRAIRTQQKEADRKFAQYLESLQSSMHSALERQLNEYVETIFDPYIDEVITDIFNSFKKMVIWDYINRGNIIYS